MSKEYHLFKTLPTEGKPEQGYVFGVERDTVNKTLEYKELFVFTVVDGVEHKFRVDLHQAMTKMCEQEGGSVAPVVMHNVMAQLEQQSKQQEVEQQQREIRDMSALHFGKAMVMASDLADKVYRTMSDFNTIDEYLAYLAHK